MKPIYNMIKKNKGVGIGITFALLLYWLILILIPPVQVTQLFSGYSFVLFLLVFIVYYLTFKLPNSVGIIVGLSFTLLLFALTLVFKWQSGYSDNFLIGGLLPYKDAKNFYVGANLILNGMPLEHAGQATERPLFPSFFSSLLLLSGKNLKIAVAILVQFVGLGLYASSRRVFHIFGGVSASLYSTLLFFYIQPWVGYTMSELFGFMMGCVAFTIMWFAASNLRWSYLILGVLILIIAISSRAGTFLIFPLLIIWTGWVFRGKKRFSTKAGTIMAIIIVISFLVVTTIYSKIMGVPEGTSFGNFSYALYGQVRGGTGWHSAIEELGTRDPDLVYKAAFDFFSRHPFSLLIAIMKSYRDFFLPGYPNIFSFDSFGQSIWLTFSMWIVIMTLLFFGLFRLIRNIRKNIASLFLAGFIGFILSIPFLPPIDGGSRFYASTVPFFFIVPAIGISKYNNWKEEFSKREPVNTFLRYGSGTLIFLTIILPIFTYTFSKKVLPTALSCPFTQNTYMIQIYPGSYIDFIHKGNTSCGIAPHICLNDFKNNNTEYTSDDFYQELYSMIIKNGTNARLIPALNLLDKKFHYFYFESLEIFEDTSLTTLAGCATEVKTKNQSIYLVKSFLIMR